MERPRVSTATIPASPGYVLLARVNTLRPGGVNAQGGQHGASIFSADGRPLGDFQHFLFEVCRRSTD